MSDSEMDRQIAEMQERGAAVRSALGRVQAQIRRVIVGYDDLIDDVIACLLSGGHALLEGVPGLGKTRLIRAFGEVLDLTTRRIQFTPDLMPADIIGTNTLVQDDAGNQRITFQEGPLFTQILLADEINRATPKTQSALLEAMQERQVTVGGTTRRLDDPFLVLATQNPLELEGTYPLPEAQLDRFFYKLLVPFPAPGDLVEIVRRTTVGEEATLQTIMDGPSIVAARRTVEGVVVAEELIRRAVAIVYATHPTHAGVGEAVREYVRYGASPRGAQAIVRAARVYALLDGRFHVAPEDILRAARPALRHRVALSFRAEAEGVSITTVLDDVLAAAATASGGATR